MRIGRADYEIKHLGQVHQAVLGIVPRDEAVTEAELRATYERIVEEGKPSFEQVMENLSPFLSSRVVGSQTFYIHRQMLSTTDVAKMLGVSKRTVQSWAQQGKLLGRQVGGRIRFAADVVDDWMKGVRHTSDQSVEDPTVTLVWDNEEDGAYDRR